MQRFYDPDDGEILIDGCDIRELNVNVLRSNIATVGQEPILFSTTIGENIRYGNPDALDRDVITAAENAGAHDFIATLPLGYNTLVGEVGCQLSGGQKQRIAIARALIQNPRILLLDEATSALDYQSEKFVQETLNRISTGRTTIVVSHRLSAIREADRILFIEHGRIIEDGTHDELMELNGNFFKMVTAGRIDDENNLNNDQITVNGCEDNQPQNNFSGECATESFNIASNDEDFFRNFNDVKNQSESKAEKIERWQLFKRIMKLSKPEWLIMFLATISAIIVGSTLPIFVILFSEIFDVSE